MSNKDKPSVLKGILPLKREQPVSIEEMNAAIREQGGNAMDSMCEEQEHQGRRGVAVPEPFKSELDDLEGCGSRTIVDALDPGDGHDVEWEPPRFDLRFKSPKL